MRNLAKLSILAVFLLTLPIAAQVKAPAISKAPQPKPRSLCQKRRTASLMSISGWRTFARTVI